jgi:predicted Rossmann fold nucleotide-binding protein DprA/Smf involved in DNA uptake
MNPVRLQTDSPLYPPALKTLLGHHAPPNINALGDAQILSREKLALFCSVKCPGNLVVKTYDLAQKLRDAGVTVIGGFHSPMERECLRILLNSPHPVIVCPARSIPKRPPSEFRKPLEEGRLLLLSAFDDSVRRADEESAHGRNRVVAALADRVFLAYAAPGSKTEFFCREIMGWKKQVFTWSENTNLTEIGATPVSTPDDMRKFVVEGKKHGGAS